jgi:transcriptional pleiotropic regulator of transition state genes
MMKSTGVVRKLDELGRLVLPKELRTVVLNINPGDPIEFYVGDNNTVVLKKYEPGCTFCGKIAEDNILFNGKLVCKECSKKLDSIHSANSPTQENSPRTNGLIFDKN